MKNKYKILIVLFAIALVTSTLLATGKTGGICDAEKSGCAVVQNSEYSTTFGISNTYLGILAFAALLILTTIHMRNPNKKLDSLLKLGTLVIGLFGLYFIYLQAFVIHAICPFCLVIDIISLATPIILFYN